MKSATKQQQAAAPTQFRQGDVLITRVQRRLPKGVRPVPRDAGRVILAYGEVTGHAHAITDAGVELLTLDDAATMQKAAEKLLRSVGISSVDLSGIRVAGILEVGPDGCALGHDEHETHQYIEGVYVAQGQREYTPERLVSVMD